MTIQMKYGKLEVGGFKAGRRFDVYFNDKGERFPEPAFALGKDDKSPRQNDSIGNGYNSACSCCYLGFCHTQLYHQAVIEKQSAK